MRILTYDEIDTLWRQKADIEPEEVPQLIDLIGNKQPNIVGYLLAAGDDILQQSEREVIFFTGVLVWYVIDSAGIETPELPLELLLENEEKNYQMLEYLAGEPETQFIDTVDKIMAGYKQSVFLRYIIDRIMEEPGKGIEIQDDHLGIIAIYLKTLLDCVDTIT
jgi:hypothetical protein